MKLGTRYGFILTVINLQNFLHSLIDNSIFQTCEGVVAQLVQRESVHVKVPGSNSFVCITFFQF